MTPRVYLDSNVFIAAYETHGAHSDHAWWLLDAIEKGALSAFTSELTLSELLVKPIERDENDLVLAYEDMISGEGQFEVLAVSRDVLIRAAHLRASRRGLRLPDAIHLASAQIAGCTHFITEDERLAMPEGMTRLGVNPFTLDDIQTES